MAVPSAALLLLLLLLVAAPPTNSFLDSKPPAPPPQQPQESAPPPAVEQPSPSPAVEQPSPPPAAEQPSPPPAAEQSTPPQAAEQPSPAPTIEPPPPPRARGPGGIVAKQFLDAHNEVRASLNVKPLVWDTHLARVARRYSIFLSLTGCKIHHSAGIYGENLWWGQGRRWKTTHAVTKWALEADNYDVATNACKPGTMCRHYTQVVWNATERVGCARVLCPAAIGVIVTCNYDPKGNWIGLRPFNVSN